LSVKGYSDKLPILLKKLVDKLTSFTIDPQRFKILKESYVRALQNFRSVASPPWLLCPHFAFP